MLEVTAVTPTESKFTNNGMLFMSERSTPSKFIDFFSSCVISGPTATIPVYYCALHIIAMSLEFILIEHPMKLSVSEIKLKGI